MSTYFPHDYLWIYTSVLPFEILELVGGKWDTFQAGWERGTHLQQAVKWNIGRKQSNLQSESHQLLSTPTSYTIQNAKVPDEFPFWAWTAKIYCLEEFSEA